MEHLREVHGGVYLIGSSELTAPDDCCVYLLDLGDLILIDAGAGKSVPALIENIESLGLGHKPLAAVVATHCHFDHIGGVPALKKKTGCQIIAHRLDSGAIEKGDAAKTAADWYNAKFPPTRVDIKLSETREVLKFEKGEILCLHTPGHTPGSISVILDRDGKRLLFGQDIHGPFAESFGSNVDTWRKSMNVLLGLKADILCEGHFGVIEPEAEVEKYIRKYLEQYKNE
ncbi:MAG TPA: MBL fold metallo-hydrolase [Thermodesulfobacteriota bacterium]|nr:MBL fold metallo-hydrolase [Thermodesulfobacteriota bacterium]